MSNCDFYTIEVGQSYPLAKETPLNNVQHFYNPCTLYLIVLLTVHVFFMQY